MRPIRQRRTATASAGGRASSPARWRWALVGLTAFVGVALIATGTWAVVRARGERANAQHAADASLSASTVTTPSATAEAGMVEVPELTGASVEEATMVLTTAGFVVKLTEEGTVTAAGSRRLVTGQDPVAGTVSAAGTIVSIVVPPAAARISTPTPAAKAKPTVAAARFVVCIDPGHQAHSDSTPEPIGPGAKATKPSVSGGATGVSTGIPESEFALQISMNLKARLEARGVKVVMTRTTNDVNLSNSQRAAIANRAKADLFVRVHCDGSTSSAASGVSTLYPADNKWTHAILADSRVAAKLMQTSVVQATGAVDRGAVQRSDLSGFNWAKVPSVLIEAGFLSNRVEDKLLASPHYQDKIATGMTDGIMAYLEAKGDK